MIDGLGEEREKEGLRDDCSRVSGYRTPTFLRFSSLAMGAIDLNLREFRRDG